MPRPAWILPANSSDRGTTAVRFRTCAGRSSKSAPPLEAATMLAWILATSNDATVRDGKEAP